MGRKKMVKLELTNSRYSRVELKDHAAEFIPYARYAGYMLVNFNTHLGSSKVYPLKPEIAERNHRLNIETTMENAKILSRIIRIYPSFNTWGLKVLATNVNFASAKAKVKIGPKTSSAGSGKTKKSAKSTKSATSRKTAKAKTSVKKSAKKKASKKVVKKQRTKR